MGEVVEFGRKAKAADPLEELVDDMAGRITEEVLRRLAAVAAAGTLAEYGPTEATSPRVYLAQRVGREWLVTMETDPAEDAAHVGTFPTRAKAMVWLTKEATICGSRSGGVELWWAKSNAAPSPVPSEVDYNGRTFAVETAEDMYLLRGARGATYGLMRAVDDRTMLHPVNVRMGRAWEGLNGWFTDADGPLRQLR